MHKAYFSLKCTNIGNGQKDRGGIRCLGVGRLLRRRLTVEHIRPAPESGCRYSNPRRTLMLGRQKETTSNVTSRRFADPGGSGSQRERNSVDERLRYALGEYLNRRHDLKKMVLASIRLLVEGKGEVAAFGSHCARKQRRTVISAVRCGVCPLF